MAKCLGQIIILTIDKTKAAIPMLSQLATHLSTCVRLEPDNWRVLLLESQVQQVLADNNAALVYVNAGGELPESIRALAAMNPTTIEHKLRRVLELQPKSLEAYCSLTVCLYSQVSAQCKGVGTSFGHLA